VETFVAPESFNAKAKKGFWISHVNEMMPQPPK
jgi:hypothetical protein